MNDRLTITQIWAAELLLDCKPANIERRITLNRKDMDMPKNEFTCDCTVVHEDIVSKVKNRMGEEELYQKTSDFFKILGDTTRIKIISAIDCHEICVCDIANILGMTKSAVSHQLATLRKAGFVKCRRDGKTAYYTLADEHIKSIIEAGTDHVQE